MPAMCSNELRSIALVPVLMALGVGICLNNTKAFLEAIWGAIRNKPSEFVRTPKYGVTGKSRKSWARGTQDAVTQDAAQVVPAVAGTVVDDSVTVVPPSAPTFLTLKRLSLPIIEIAFGCYMAVCAYLSISMYFMSWDKATLAAIPFLLIFASGYLYVGVGSVYALWKMQLQAEEEFAAAQEPEIA